MRTLKVMVTVPAAVALLLAPAACTKDSGGDPTTSASGSGRPGGPGSSGGPATSGAVPTPTTSIVTGSSATTVSPPAPPTVPTVAPGAAGTLAVVVSGAGTVDQTVTVTSCNGPVTGSVGTGTFTLAADGTTLALVGVRPLPDTTFTGTTSVATGTANSVGSTRSFRGQAASGAATLVVTC